MCVLITCERFRSAESGLWFVKGMVYWRGVRLSVNRIIHRLEQMHGGCSSSWISCVLPAGATPCLLSLEYHRCYVLTTAFVCRICGAELDCIHRLLLLTMLFAPLLLAAVPQTARHVCCGMEGKECDACIALPYALDLLLECNYVSTITIAC